MASMNRRGILKFFGAGAAAAAVPVAVAEAAPKFEHQEVALGYKIETVKIEHKHVYVATWDDDITFDLHGEGVTGLAWPVPRCMYCGHLPPMKVLDPVPVAPIG